MTRLKLIAIATAAATALPAIAAYAAPGPVPTVRDLAELSQQERSGIDNPQPWVTAELSQQERSGIDNPHPWTAS